MTFLYGFGNIVQQCKGKGKGKGAGLESESSRNFSPESQLIAFN